MNDQAVQVRLLGRVDYSETVAAMQSFTVQRTADTPDELWICEHAAVYTQGFAAKTIIFLPQVTSLSWLPTAAGGSRTMAQDRWWPIRCWICSAPAATSGYVYRLEESFDPHPGAL